MHPHLNSLSVKQAKLEAVLGKMHDLVPFVEDTECDLVLKLLRDVVDVALRRKDDPKKSLFQDMPITDLLGLNDKKGGLEVGVVLNLTFFFLFFSFCFDLCCRNPKGGSDPQSSYTTIKWT